jgi:IS1 family transposase
MSKMGLSITSRRYQCKGCQYHYTVKQKSDVRFPETRQLAIDLYLEGMGFRAIGRVLKVSNTSVLGWVKKSGKAVLLQAATEPVDVAELDEMHTYVGKKNYLCLWLAVDRQGKQYIAFVCGDRSTQPGLKLWDKLKHLPIDAFAADYWRSYEEFIHRNSTGRQRKKHLQWRETSLLTTHYL